MVVIFNLEGLVNLLLRGALGSFSANRSMCRAATLFKVSSMLGAPGAGNLATLI